MPLLSNHTSVPCERSLHLAKDDSVLQEKGSFDPFGIFF